MNATPTPGPGTDALAYHEAGHAVIHVLLGGTLQRVSIVRDDRPGAPKEPAAGPESLEDRIAVLLAGEVAESLSGQHVTGVAEGTDWERALRLAASATVEPEGLLEAERQRVLALLRNQQHWRRVVAVAHALMAQQRLEGAQLQELVGAP